MLWLLMIRFALAAPLQDAPAPASPAVREDVVVTAERGPEPQQEVPASVSVPCSYPGSRIGARIGVRWAP